MSFVALFYWFVPVYNYHLKLSTKPAIKDIRYDDLSLKKCNNDVNFTIHGWWPEYDLNNWPSWCDKHHYREFNLTDITPGIQQLLHKYWYACPEWNIESTTLWKHEWEKHGTCIKGITQREYFKHTLEVFLQAQYQDFYGCCTKSFFDNLFTSISTFKYLNEKSECMIPFSKDVNTTRWLGRC